MVSLIIDSVVEKAGLKNYRMSKFNIDIKLKGIGSEELHSRQAVMLGLMSEEQIITMSLL